MWIAIATPIIMIASLVLIIVLWVNTNLIVALVVFGLLAGAAIAVYTKRRNRYREI